MVLQWVILFCTRIISLAPYELARVDEDGIEKGLKKFGLI